MTNTIFITIVGMLALIATFSCFFLNKKRRIAHTATIEDDPSGASSDFLIGISFLLFTLFFAMAIIFPAMNKNKIKYCHEFIAKNIHATDKMIKEELNYCTMVINDK